LWAGWEGVALRDIVPAAIVGVLLGLEMYLYYFLLQDEDISHVIGMTHSYPLIVAFLSFVFLGERLSPVGYFAVVLIIVGATLLSLRIRSFRLGSFWFFGGIVLTVAGYEFFMKVSSYSLSPVQAIAVTSVALWVTTLPSLLSGTIRSGVVRELGNVRWALVSESLTFGALLSTYFAMAGLEATIVASISAVQPLVVVGLEYVTHRRLLIVSKDTSLPGKLGAIGMLVAGIALLFLFELA
jgi:drug/metabolite transporter (DMT)-like permease